MARFNGSSKPCELTTKPSKIWNALLQFEESISGEAQERPRERQGLDLLSIPELCQELGIGKSRVYWRLRSGEIPSVKLGRSIKIKRENLEENLEEDLKEYLESRRYRPLRE